MTTADTITSVAGGLRSWHDGPAKRAVVEFVARVCGADGSEPVPLEERIAVFDNDGTLWCEKPMPIQLDFILRRLVEMAEADPGPAHAPAVAGRLRARLRLAGRGRRAALRR